MQDEKEQKNEVKIKEINEGGTWENMKNNTLAFVNSNNLQNMGQLIDITPSKTSSGSGCILIYYWSEAPSKKMTNAPILRCETNRRNQKSHLEAANLIKDTVATEVSQGRLFKISHARQANNHPITFIWYWNTKPQYINTTKKPSYTQTDHILRNHGNNVATMDRFCTVNNYKSVEGATNIFQSGYDVNKYAYVKTTEIFQINFDRAYILNSLKFWLYDADNRIYKYVIEVSRDGLSWQQIANHQNKASWETVQFDEQFVKHVRFIEGSNTTNQYFHLCKFAAFYDYSLLQ